MKQVVVLALCAGLTGCGAVDLKMPRWGKADAGAARVPDGELRPVPRPDSMEDGTSGDRSGAPAGALGMTVVSLGSASEPGMWLKTPLVVGPRQGDVIWQGRRAEVTLIPIDGENSAGSRLSLQAMQALGLPLTELAEVQVIAR